MVTCSRFQICTYFRSTLWKITALAVGHLMESDFNHLRRETIGVNRSKQSLYWPSRRAQIRFVFVLDNCRLNIPFQPFLVEDWTIGRVPARPQCRYLPVS